jgi:hypothetical protein
MAVREMPIPANLTRITQATYITQYTKQNKSVTFWNLQ